MNSKEVLSYVAVGIISTVLGVVLFLWQQDQQSIENKPKIVKYTMNENPIGSKIDNLQLTSIYHEAAQLYDYKSPYLLINFWATWCVPCRKEMPLLDKLNKEHKNLQVLGFSFDEDVPIYNYLQKTAISYPLFLSTADSVKLNALFGNKVGGIPYTVLLDQNHNIIMTHSGEITEQQITQLLK